MSYEPLLFFWSGSQSACKPSLSPTSFVFSVLSLLVFFKLDGTLPFWITKMLWLVSCLQNTVIHRLSQGQSTTNSVQIHPNQAG